MDAVVKMDEAPLAELVRDPLRGEGAVDAGRASISPLLDLFLPAVQLVCFPSL